MCVCMDSRLHSALLVHLGYGLRVVSNQKPQPTRAVGHCVVPRRHVSISLAIGHACRYPVHCLTRYAVEADGRPCSISLDATAAPGPSLSDI